MNGEPYLIACTAHSAHILKYTLIQWKGNKSMNIGANELVTASTLDTFICANFDQDF